MLERWWNESYYISIFITILLIIRCFIHTSLVFSRVTLLSINWSRFMKKYAIMSIIDFPTFKIFVTSQKHLIRVWHRGLIEKFKSYGIYGLLLDWTGDYVTNRKQFVMVNKTVSSVLVSWGATGISPWTSTSFTIC